ncbi:MAG: HD domain-containing protein [Minisyncoccia bacterium]
MNSKEVSKKVVELGKLVHLFGNTDRAIFYEDGVTPESDTDHTVMLGLIACALAHSYDRTLDIGKVAQFALVHDLVEAYAGDTQTLNASQETLRIKDKVEHAALQRIKSEFDHVFPWISETIEEYEGLRLPEATFIKTLDKCMPKITHILNKGVMLKPHFKDSLSAMEYFKKQNEKISNSYGAKHPIVTELNAVLADEACEQTYSE